MAQGAPPKITDHDLLRPIGSGSYGEVWLARSVIGTFRAIKVVYRSTFDNEQPYEREFRGIQKFEPVSRTHEGLVDILQVGRNDQAGYYYYIMELADDRLQGQEIRLRDYEAKTLGDEVARRGKLPFGECLDLSLSLTSALAHLHRRGLIHRDIKPANIIFVNGIPKIADIGLVADAASSGSFVGTPGFIPPEGPGTAQADIYSLGKVLYEISTGKDRLEFPELPAAMGDTTSSRELMELNEIVLKACDKDSRTRYQTAEEMHADLVLLKAGKSVQRLRTLERRFNQLTKASLFIGLAATVIAVMFFLERARRNEVRQRLVGRFVSSGISAMKEGDLIGSLPLFTEALRLDLEDGNTKNEETHRLRIGSVLERCPQLVQMWLQPKPVMRAEFAPGGDAVLLSVTGGDCRLWNVADGRAMSESFGKEVNANFASFSRDGRSIVAAGDGKNFRITSVADPKAFILLSHTAPLESAELSPDGLRIVGASEDTNAIIWDRTGRVPALRLAGHSGQVRHASFSPDGLRVVTASTDSSAIIWDSRTGQPGPRMWHTNWVYHATFSPDGKLVATASFDRTARIWDAATGAALFPPFRHSDGVRSVAFSPDGELLATAGLDFVVRIWDFRHGKEAFPPLPHSGKVTYAAFSPDGKLLVTSCWDGTVRVWDLARTSGLPPPSFVIYSPDGRRYAKPNGSSLEIKNDDNKNEGHHRIVSTIPRMVRSESQACFSRHGERLVTITPDASDGSNRTVQAWNADTGQPAGQAFVIDGALTNTAVTDVADKVAVYGGGQLVVHQTQGGEVLLNVTLTNALITFARFSPTGNTIAVASTNVLQVWDVGARRWMFPPLVHAATVMDVEFANDGRSLVTACANDDYDALAGQVWDARTGTPVGAPLLHADGVRHAEFSPDSRRVATASEDFSAMIWDARLGTHLTPEMKHGEQVHHISFNQDGRWVITATSISGQPGVARIWDASSGDPITPPILHPERLKSARFVADDRKFLTVTRQNATRVWNLPRATWPVEDLIGITQLLSAQPIKNTGSALLPPQEALFKSWETLRKKYPEEFQLRAK